MKTPPKFTRYQATVIAILTFLQFTVILDFMVLSPLGALLMPALQISPAQFGIVVSAYAFSAGIAGALTAGFADRFDRKKLLLFFYCGFLIGTLFCGWAQNFLTLLLARIVTGLFGGMIGAVVLAITADLFPVEQRGRVFGYIQAAFAASQVLGIPAGLYFSNLWGWHAPFFLIVFIGAGVGLAIFTVLKPIDEHLKLQKGQNALVHLYSTLTNKNYTLAFVSTALLATGGFMIMPFASAFSVHNLGVDMDHLPLVYLVTGLSVFIAGPLIGRIADTRGHYPVFFFGSILSIAMVVLYTHLGPTPLYIVILVNTILFVGIFSRIIPSQALMSAVPEPATRGSFMAIGSSLQQMSGGFAAMIAGLIISEAPDGKILHFEVVGYILVGTTLVTLVAMNFVNKMVMRNLERKKVQT